jgi:hypothetical protein
MDLRSRFVVGFVFEGFLGNIESLKPPAVEMTKALLSDLNATQPNQKLWGSCFIEQKSF